jgi:hypothetical protein
MNHWTTGEVRILKRAYEEHLSGEHIAVLLPRHPIQSIRTMAWNLGYVRRRTNWLRIAHEHFARREAGLLA